MGKKKTATALKNPETIKDLGNKAFLQANYQEAIDHYTKAIELSGEKPSHIYFSNRANAKLEFRDFSGCIEDCDTAIKIEPTFQKSYLRKAKAFQILARFNEGLEAIQSGIKLDSENQDLKEVERQIIYEIENDKVVSKDHPIRKKFDDLVAWIDKGGANHDKLRLRFYESTHRGVHAACDIKLGDRVL